MMKRFIFTSPSFVPQVIMVDPSHSAIRRDARINWICAPVMKHRENRGLTAAGRKSRGMLNKSGNKNSRVRPSVRAAISRLPQRVQ